MKFATMSDSFLFIFNQSFWILTQFWLHEGYFRFESIKTLIYDRNFFK